MGHTFNHDHNKAIVSIELDHYNGTKKQFQMLEEETEKRVGKLARIMLRRERKSK